MSLRNVLQNPGYALANSAKAGGTPAPRAVTGPVSGPGAEAPDSQLVKDTLAMHYAHEQQMAAANHSRNMEFQDAQNEHQARMYGLESTRIHQAQLHERGMLRTSGDMIDRLSANNRPGMAVSWAPGSGTFKMPSVQDPEEA